MPGPSLTGLAARDPELAAAISDETARQARSINLIASENYASAAVREAQGSVLTNKYAEGYPGRRYYGGCEHVDVAERLAVARAIRLFGAEHANVQPHSGAQANMAVYHSQLSPGDTVMGLRLDQGGHLTHGSPVNFSGRHYSFVYYGVDRETELIDMEAVARLAEEHRPKILVAGATAYPRFYDFRRFREIADDVGAMLMVDMAHFSGLVAAGVHPSPVRHAHAVTSTTHKTLRGPRGGMILCTEEMARSVDRGVFPNVQGGPLMHAVAAKAAAYGEALTSGFKAYAQRVVANAAALSEALSDGGARMVSGGTDNHLMLVDLRPLGLTGAAAEEALDRVGITTNRNAIPYDPERPRVTSGLRLGTPAISTRGLGPDEASLIGELIIRALRGIDDPSVGESVRRDVGALAGRFPVPA